MLIFISFRFKPQPSMILFRSNKSLQKYFSGFETTLSGMQVVHFDLVHDTFWGGWKQYFSWGDSGKFNTASLFHCHTKVLRQLSICISSFFWKITFINQISPGDAYMGQIPQDGNFGQNVAHF